MLFSTYENVFRRVSFHFKRPYLRIISKLLSLLLFNIRFNLLERWGSHLVHADTNSFSGTIKSSSSLLIISETLNPNNAVKAEFIL